jgi:uncharacterized protein (TIGR02466 family)
MEKIINPFFSGIFHSNECKVKNHQDILNYLNVCWSHYPNKEYGCVFTGNHSNDFTASLELDKLFNELCDIILTKVDSLYKANLKSIDINNITNRELHIDKMWFNIIAPYGQQTKHHHNECLFAGTYYVKVPECGGPIIFQNPNPWAYHLNQQCVSDTLTIDEYGIIPNDGDLILWPGWMTHEVYQNRSDDIRISISFAINFKKEE